MRITKETKILMRLGSYIDEIHFNDIPDYHVLLALFENEKNNNIIFYFPLHKVTTMDEFLHSPFSGNIYSANFETDLFMEWQELYSFPNIKSLALTCYNNTATDIEFEDMNNMILSLKNLENLHLLILNISEMQNQIIEDISSAMKFSLDNVIVNIE